MNICCRYRSDQSSGCVTTAPPVAVPPIRLTTSEGTGAGREAPEWSKMPVYCIWEREKISAGMWVWGLLVTGNLWLV